jgi:hypothetical protein
LDEHSFLGKNQKLAPKWSGPHKILRLKGDCNVELQLKHNNRKTVVHANRLKPYFVASKNLAVCPDFMKGQQPEPEPAAPIDDNPTPQTNDDAYQLYDDILTAPNLPNLQHAQIAPPDSPSLVVNPPSIARRTRTRTRTASSTHTHTLSDEPPSARTRSRSQLSSFSPVKPTLIMPQVTFHPLPIPEGGEGLQEENEDNQLTINILNDEEGWTIVRRKKKKKKQAKTDKSDGWNKQQKINFERYGDIWYEPPYKNYRTCDEGPIALLPLPQQVQQGAQQPQALPAPQVQPPPAPPLPLQPQAVPGVHPLPAAPPPPHRPPQIQKRFQIPPDLPPIQEEDDDDQPDQELQGLDPGGRPLPQEHLEVVPAHQGPQQPRHPKVGPDEPAGAGADQELDLAFGQLAISPPGTRRPGSPKISPPGPLPRTPPRTGAANPFAALLPGVHEPGPPSERTRQMRKELEKTLLQRLAEESAAKKKKEKEIKKEKK